MHGNAAVGQAQAPETLRVLLTEDNPTDVVLLRRALESVPEGRFELTVTDSLEECCKRLENERFDVILADLCLPDSFGLETFQRIYQAAAGAAVVVLTGTANEALAEEAVRQGAQDYLVKGQMTPQNLVRRLMYAVGRTRRRQTEQQSEVARIEILSHPPATSVTGRIFLSGPLRDTNPELHALYRRRYAALLADAIERRFFKMAPAGDPVRDLAEELGQLRAGPRDVIEIHVEALKECMSGQPPAHVQTFLEEGRILVLDLMGKLVSFYRNYYTVKSRKEEHSWTDSF